MTFFLLCLLSPENVLHNVVLTIEPIKENIPLEVIIVDQLERMDIGGLEIGVTTNNPDQFKPVRTMTDCHDGASYMISGRNLVRNQRRIDSSDLSTKRFKVLKHYLLSCKVTWEKMWETKAKGKGLESVTSWSFPFDFTIYFIAQIIGSSFTFTYWTF